MISGLRYILFPVFSINLLCIVFDYWYNLSGSTLLTSFLYNQFLVFIIHKKFVLFLGIKVNKILRFESFSWKRFIGILSFASCFVKRLTKPDIASTKYESDRIFIAERKLVSLSSDGMCMSGNILVNSRMSGRCGR